MPRPLTGKPRGRPKGYKNKPKTEPAKVLPSVDVAKVVEVQDLNKDKDVQIRRLKEETVSLKGLVNFLKGKLNNGKTEKIEQTTNPAGSDTDATPGTANKPDAGNQRGGVFGDII